MPEHSDHLLLHSKMQYLGAGLEVEQQALKPVLQHGMLSLQAAAYCATALALAPENNF